MIFPTNEELDRAAQIIKQGGLVAFPTETVYGLGANALDRQAVARIFAAKGRPLASPLIVHVDCEAMARTLTADWPERARVLAQRFWPGPLTLVLKKAEIVPDVVTAGLDSVGVRVPAHPVALELIRARGRADCGAECEPIYGDFSHNGRSCPRRFGRYGKHGAGRRTD